MQTAANTDFFLIVIVIKPLFSKQAKHILLLPNLGDSADSIYLQTKARFNKASWLHKKYHLHLQNIIKN
jgi:hypothetical protein